MNARLTALLDKPMKHISDVRRCFNFCRTEDDVEEVLGMIPRKFGDFEVEYPVDGDTFIVTNTFFENGDWYDDQAEYGFYTEEDELDDVRLGLTKNEMCEIDRFDNLKEDF